jgi:hypothetical protein
VKARNASLESVATIRAPHARGALCISLLLAPRANQDLGSWVEVRVFADLLLSALTHRSALVLHELT